jgi:hypothetical protein
LIGEGWWKSNRILQLAEWGRIDEKCVKVITEWYTEAANTWLIDPKFQIPGPFHSYIIILKSQKIKLKAHRI